MEEEKKFNKLLIIDASYLLHRALGNKNLMLLESKSGLKSGGVYGFLNILKSEMNKFNEYYPVLCWDCGLSKRRVDVYPEYKSTRRLQENATLEQIVQYKQFHDLYDMSMVALINVLQSINIPSILLDHQEGDDLQYLTTKLCKESIIVSDDKDMIQLVCENVSIRRSLVDQFITKDSDEYYLHPRYTLRKSIVGDFSDNIPKCANGLGEKGADDIAYLLCKEETNYTNGELDLDKCLAHLNRILNSNSSCKQAKKIADLVLNWKQLEINWKLINLRLVEDDQLENIYKIIEFVVYNKQQSTDLLDIYDINQDIISNISNILSTIKIR